MTFERCDCVIDILSEHRQRTMSNEKNKIKRLVYIRKEDLKTDSSSSNIDKDQLNQQNKVRKENHVSSEYPKSNDIKKLSSIYKKWTFLFREEKSAKILSKHQSWDHEIKLESEKQFTFEPIYILFSKELEELRKYLKMNEKKNSFKSHNHSQNTRFCLCQRKTKNYVSVSIIESWTK